MVIRWYARRKVKADDQLRDVSQLVVVNEADDQTNFGCPHI
jgi:hypothetical protein